MKSGLKTKKRRPGPGPVDCGWTFGSRARFLEIRASIASLIRIPPSQSLCAPAVIRALVADRILRRRGWDANRPVLRSASVRDHLRRRKSVGASFVVTPTLSFPTPVGPHRPARLSVDSRNTGSMGSWAASRASSRVGPAHVKRDLAGDLVSVRAKRYAEATLRPRRRSGVRALDTAGATLLFSFVRKDEHRIVRATASR
jgi:phage gp46-like protein